jgi:hypothetical protein
MVGEVSLTSVSDKLQPEPDTVTTWPVNPVPGVSTNDAVVTVKVSDTEPWTTLASVIVTVYAIKLAPGSTVKYPDRIPFASTLQRGSAPAKRTGNTGTVVIFPVVQLNAAAYPDPDSVTIMVGPLPPLCGFNTNVDSTRNSVCEKYPFWLIA